MTQCFPWNHGEQPDRSQPPNRTSPPAPRKGHTPEAHGSRTGICEGDEGNDLPGGCPHHSKQPRTSIYGCPSWYITGYRGFLRLQQTPPCRHTVPKLPRQPPSQGCCTAYAGRMACPGGTGMSALVGGCRGAGRVWFGWAADCWRWVGRCVAGSSTGARPARSRSGSLPAASRLVLATLAALPLSLRCDPPSA